MARKFFVIRNTRFGKRTYPSTEEECSKPNMRRLREGLYQELSPAAAEYTTKTTEAEPATEYTTKTMEAKPTAKVPKSQQYETTDLRPATGGSRKKS